MKYNTGDKKNRVGVIVGKEWSGADNQDAPLKKGLESRRNQSRTTSQRIRKKSKKGRNEEEKYEAPKGKRQECE